MNYVERMVEQLGDIVAHVTGVNLNPSQFGAMLALTMVLLTRNKIRNLFTVIVGKVSYLTVISRPKNGSVQIVVKGTGSLHWVLQITYWKRGHNHGS